MQLQLFTEETVTIYGIKPKDGEVFYIGSTKDDTKKRFAQHLCEVRTGKHHNRHFSRTVTKFGIDNVEIVPLMMTTEDQRFDVEYKLINEYIAKGFKLTNIQLEQKEYSKQYRPRTDEWPDSFDFLGEMTTFLTSPFQHWKMHPTFRYNDLWLTWYTHSFLFGDRKEWLQNKIGMFDYLIFEELALQSPRLDDIQQARCPIH